MNAHSNGASTNQAGGQNTQVATVGETPRQDSGWPSLREVGEFVGNVGWPVVAVIALLLLRGPISRINRLTYKDFVVDIGKELKQAEARAQTESGQPLSSGATSEEVARAGRVAELASGAGPDAIRGAALDLAVEYETIRGSMPSGDARTRRMEAVMAKMRALGRAICPLRHELMVSPSPGQRLAAIAALQVSPDYEALDWLASRLTKDERPFVSYHAAVALVTAAKDPLARSNLAALHAVRMKVEAIEPNLPPDSDRMHMLRSFRSAVDTLGSP